MTMPNMFKINDTVYHVRTQAGFKNAKKACLKTGRYTKGEEPQFYGFPDKYPVVVIFERIHYNYLVKSAPLANFYADTQKHISDLCRQLQLVKKQDTEINAPVNTMKETKMSEPSFDSLLEVIKNNFKKDEKYTALVIEDLTKLIDLELPVCLLSDLEKDTVCVYWKRGNLYLSIDFETDGKHVWRYMHNGEMIIGLWNNTKDFPIALYLNILSNFGSFRK